MTPHTTRRLAAWAARCADAVLGPVCLRFAGWLDYWDTKLADACNEEEEM